MQNKNRRALVKGAAWAAPVVIATAAVPAYAASPQPALDGWLHNRVFCNNRTAMTYHFDARGSYPSRGLWVSGANATARVSNIKITQYVASNAGRLTFQVGATSQWSLLSFDPNAPVRAGYYAYSTTYQGTMRFDRSTGLWFPDSQPYFTAASNVCVAGLRVTTVRQATVNGKNYVTERSGTLRPSPS